MNQRDIGLFHLPPRKLRSQLAMRLVIFGDENQTAGGFVQAMDNSGAQIAANRRKLAEVMQQRVDQRALVALIFRGPCSGMHHHARGFVDHREISVFINQVEREYLRQSPAAA